MNNINKAHGIISHCECNLAALSIILKTTKIQQSPLSTKHPPLSSGGRARGKRWGRGGGEGKKTKQIIFSLPGFCGIFLICVMLEPHIFCQVCAKQACLKSLIRATCLFAGTRKSLIGTLKWSVPFIWFSAKLQRKAQLVSYDIENHVWLAQLIEVWPSMW